MMRLRAVFSSLALLPISFLIPLTGAAREPALGPSAGQIGAEDVMAAASGSDWGLGGFLGLEVDTFSRYVWRGQVRADQMCIQPSITAGSRDIGIALNIWGSAAIKGRTAPDNLDLADEIDFTLSFDRSFGEKGTTVGVSLGYIQYVYPNRTDKHTEEVFGGFSLNTVLAPGITFFYDFGLRDAFYIAPEIGPEISLDGEGNVKFSTRASAGFGERNGSFSFRDVSASMSVDVRRGALTMRPTSGVSYFKYSDSGGEEKGRTEFWGGMAISFSR